MLLHQFTDDVIKDMEDLKMQVIDIREKDDDWVLVKCKNVDSGRFMSLRFKSPILEDEAFDFTRSFLVDAKVYSGRRVYKTYEYLCATATFVSASGAKTTVRGV